MDWEDDHPDWQEVRCDGCKVRARGTPMALIDWMQRHESHGHHAVMKDQEAKQFRDKVLNG